ncbi:acetyl-CoA acetyltransferase [Albimonas pacifica]|uniref:Acetyl-CoA acetyltransferase n=1 Tax=Albimonas pacifica TaxID=1114924 RepID=A0A1I3E3Q1_9RHOB|nr:acetyl-CoA acetyltransferase [Albimonas pacifica]SFH93616.1 Acetyl-CoA acetyltransferase [Albimonas pacifica]
MTGFPRGRTAIVSAVTHGMGETPGFHETDLAAAAAVKALKKVGLTPADVDGLWIAQPTDMLAGLSFAQYLGIHPRITGNNRVGGSSFLTHMHEAALALDAGLIDVALIAYGSNQRSSTGKLVSTARPDPWDGPYKPVLPVAAYAFAAARHMHQYGTTPEQLAEVAVAARGWAKLNPDAFMRGDLTVDDVLSARRVADPLGVRDCCLVTDGAAAIVMTRADRAKDLTEVPAHVLGIAAATTHMQVSSMADLTVSAAAESGPRAMAQAGVKPSDFDVVELYDAFSINTLLFLEDLGFCKKGEGGAFVSGGRIAPGGELPVNTNGGGLSCVHPGMYGLFTVVEAVEQITGAAGERQVEGAKLALSHANGGFLSSQVTAVLGAPETV